MNIKSASVNWKWFMLALVFLCILQPVSAAYNFPGMQNASDFIDDLIQILPRAITLAIYWGIIGLVGFLLYKFRSGTGGKR